VISGILPSPLLTVVHKMYTFAPLLVVLVLHVLQICNAFNSVYRHGLSINILERKNFLTMKWTFGKGTGSLSDLGGIGSQGEYYYIPSKKPSLKAPEHVLGKERTIPLFPRNQVLGPLGEEYLGVYEMRYRQLLNDVGEGGVFGHVYYSQENSKIALVGTLARVKRTERLDDGGIYVVMEGVGRFYTRDVVAEKPYLKARVQTFKDYTENEPLASSLEMKVLNEVRYSVKLMKLLYPQNNYTMNNLVIRNKPTIPIPGMRSVQFTTPESEIERRSRFSFAAIDMLKVDPVSKLIFLQEPIIERRFGQVLKVLEESITFLEGELRKRGIVTDVGMEKLKREALADMSDLDPVTMKSWVPDNYENGMWKMGPTLLE
jgi:ATP-dependent protease La (LON) substrate-binding domain